MLSAPRCRPVWMGFIDRYTAHDQHLPIIYLARVDSDGTAGPFHGHAELGPVLSPSLRYDTEYYFLAAGFPRPVSHGPGEPLAMSCPSPKVHPADRWLIDQL